MRSIGALARDVFARSPIPWDDLSGRSLRSMLTGGTPADREAQLGAMETSGTLFTIVNGIASDVAAVEWHLHRTRGVRAGTACAYPGCEAPGVAWVQDHQALRVWNKPNPFMTGQEFRESQQQHVDLTGEGWWVVDRSVASIPTEMWPARPDRMSPVPHRTEFLAGYVYVGPRGEEIALGVDEVVQIRMPNPLDLYRGLGPVQAAMVELEGNRFTLEWNRQFFANSASPGGLIEIPADKVLNDTQWRRLRQQWGEQYQGVRNAHRVGILEGGVKWVDRSYNQRDMQFSELYQLGKKGIREAFRYPEFMLGSTENTNKATASETEVFYARRLLKPRLERIRLAANSDFLPMFGPNPTGLEFVYDNPVPADREADNAERDSQVDAYVKLVDSGVDPDDAARTVGLPVMRHRPAPDVPEEDPLMEMAT